VTTATTKHGPGHSWRDAAAVLTRIGILIRDSPKVVHTEAISLQAAPGLSSDTEPVGPVLGPDTPTGTTTITWSSSSATTSHDHLAHQTCCLRPDLAGAPWPGYGDAMRLDLSRQIGRLLSMSRATPDEREQLISAASEPGVATVATC
jgi:hypothetical protein